MQNVSIEICYAFSWETNLIILIFTHSRLAWIDFDYLDRQLSNLAKKIHLFCVQQTASDILTLEPSFFDWFGFVGFQNVAVYSSATKKTKNHHDKIISKKSVWFTGWLVLPICGHGTKVSSCQDILTTSTLYFPQKCSEITEKSILKFLLI